MTIRCCAALLLCLCMHQALAVTPIQLRHDASPTVHVTVSNVAGTVNVIGWDRDQVEVSGTLGDGAEPLLITGNNAELAIKVEAQGGSSWFNFGSTRRMGATTLELHVPRAASLTVNLVSAPLVIDGTAGGKLDIHTISGRVRLNARTPQLSVDSISGGIELAGHAGQAKLQTVSGDIVASVLGSTAKLHTVSGRINISGGPWRALNVSSVSGDMQIGGGMAVDGKLDIDNMSGDIQLQLPANTIGTLHAGTFSGDLRSDFGTPKHAEHGPGSTLDTELGGGRATLTIETFSGDLRVLRANED